ncbi:MAG TPA: carbohydrate binding domain-containing protein [Bacteroidales bacterium]|nr:carbohydrate binding domain-containing protein [Bacteroidales bacterium]
MKKSIILSLAALLNFSIVLVLPAQEFINGDFEQTTAPPGVDQINLSNEAFSSMMAHTYAFGTYGDMDIINSTVYSGAAQSGAWFVALTGGGTDAISMELTSSLIEGKTYSISFWDKAGAGFIPQEFQIGISTEKNTFGIPVCTAEMPVLAVWTRRTFSFIAPISGKYITVQLAGITDISKWAQVDNFSFANPENEIITQKISGSPFCACNTVMVPFTAKGSFHADNVFTVQLSDADGSFSSQINLSDLKSNANSGTIACSLPCDIVASSKYRIRVISSSPAIIGNDNGSDLDLNNETHYAANIKAFPDNVITEGVLVTFRAETGNNSKKTYYQWQVNGTDAGNSETFTSASLIDGDVVRLIVSIDNPCKINRTVISNEIVMSVLSSEKPSVSIEVSGSSTIQKGKSLTCIAFSENGGSNPKFQWKINGITIGGNSSELTFNKFKNGDKVSVVMTPDHEGSGHNTVASNTITIHVEEPEEAHHDEKVQAKNINNKHHIGILKRKPFLWSKKSRRFYKPIFFVHKKNKNTLNTCYKY